MGTIRFLMNIFLASALILSLPLAVKADPNLEKKYLDAYNLVREAFEDKKQGDFRNALEKFQTAKQYLWEVQSEYPQWQTQTINYLLRDCDAQIQYLYQNNGIEGGTQSKAEARVDLLVDQLMAIKSKRESSSYRTQQTPQKKSFPSLSSLIKGRDKQPRQNRTERAEPVRRSVTVPQTVQYGDSRMMSAKLEALEAALASKKDEIEQWRLQYSILENKAREELQTLSSQFSNEKTKLDAEIVELKKEINTDKQQLRALRVESDKKVLLENSLTEAKNKIAELETALQEAQKIRSKAEEESKILEGQVVLSLKEEFQKDKTALMNQFKNQQEEYKTQIEQLDNAIKEKEKVISELEEKLTTGNSKSLAQKNQTIAGLEQKLLETVKEKSQAEQAKSTIERNFAQIEQEKSKIEQELVSVKQELEKAKYQAKEEKSSVNEYKTRIAQLKEKESILVKEIEAQKDIIKKLENDESVSKDVEAQISRMESRLKFKDKIIRELEEKINKKQKELAQQSNIVSGIKEQLNVKINEYKELENKFVEEQKNAARYKLKNEKINETLTALEKKVSKYEEEREYFLEQEKKYENQNKAFEAERNNFKQRIAGLENEMNQTRSELGRKEGSVRKVLVEADEKLAKVKADNEKTIMDLLQSFKREKSKWQDEIGDLKSKLADKSNDAKILANYQKAEKRLADMLEENDAIKSENKTLLEEVKQLKEKLGNSVNVSEKEKLYSQYKEQETANHQLTDKIAKYESRISELKKILESSESEKKSLYEEINQLNTMVSQLRLDLKRTDEINSQLRQTVSQVKLSSQSRIPVSVSPKTVQAPVVVEEPEANKEDLRKRDALTEEDVRKILQKVKDLFRQGEYQKALKLLEKQLEIYPANDRFLFYKGLTFSRMKENENAIQAYRQAIEVNPKMAKAYNNLGNLYSQNKQYGKAIENLKKATELDPKLSEAFNNMGIVHSHLGQYDESIKAFIRATEINPRLVAAFYNLGQIYYHDKKWDAAKTSFEKVLSLDPDHVEARDYIAQINKDSSASETQLALEPEVD